MTVITKKKLIEIYKRAREIISNEENWTKMAMARNKKGETGTDASPEAYSFCSLGAIYKARSEVLGRRYGVTSVNDILGRGVDYDIIGFNDSTYTTHAKVLARFDKAIAKLERPWWKFW